MEPQPLFSPAHGEGSPPGDSMWGGNKVGNKDPASRLTLLAAAESGSAELFRQTAPARRAEEGCLS